MHIRTVHRDHSTEGGDEDKFVREVKLSCYGVHVRAVCCPLLYLCLLASSAAEEEELKELGFLAEAEYLLHQVGVVGRRPCRVEGGDTEADASRGRLRYLGVESLEGLL